jgi:thioesterase domain-containing protein
MTSTDPIEILNAKLRAMPPVAATGIRAAGFEDGSLRLSAPLVANVNDKGCAFGGSLASLMTLAAWGWLMLRLDEAGLAAEVYVADSQIRYLAPLYDDLVGAAQLAPDQDWPAILRCLRDRQRARATMQAQVFDAAGKAVASLTARFALILVPAAAAPMS